MIVCLGCLATVRKIIGFSAVMSILAALISLYYVFDRAGFVLNTTASMPVGIYRKVHRRPQKGDIVGACIPDWFACIALQREYISAGSCSNGTRPVMKYVLAVGSEYVSVTRTGVRINGRLISNSIPLVRDSKNRPIPIRLGSYFLGEDEYWLQSNRVQGSLDSRYFGPVTEIISVVEPYLTKHELCQMHVVKFLIGC